MKGNVVASIEGDGNDMCHTTRTVRIKAEMEYILMTHIGYYGWLMASDKGA